MTRSWTLGSESAGIARRLEEGQRERRERSLEEKAYLSARRTRRCAAQDLKAVFKVMREPWPKNFFELHGKRFPKAAGVFEAVIGGALSYPEPPTAGSIKVDPYAVIGG